MRNKTSRPRRPIFSLFVNSLLSVPRSDHISYSMFLPFNEAIVFITRASVGKPKSENATILSQKGGHGPRRSCVDRRKWGRETRHCSLVRESFGKASQRCRFFFRKDRSSNYILQRQPGKRMLETFS